MGVPKFFRWVSERYPLCSQLIAEGSIPEFDNLYLDMNGIIHNCSHNNSDDAHKRIKEEEIFVNIFAYIEHLFSKIKPKKTFFMAIDGVAPRAKMNQQRSRRFRTAKEAKDLRDKAIAKGEELPEEPPFDSNCITPGTPFMARLSEQLKYFISKKVNEDANWRGIEVILSGHEVPGEGEHKIMEYIRLAKAQPDYNPNLRHCLYGLDADLIMLGLLSHDPHFCLLREEVVFGPQRKKANKGLEAQNFYLMHLSLFREYLNLEFSSLATTPDLGFEYDLERIIDDWILLVIFVGNDFLPHLPGIHIHEGALNLLYGIYKRVLPKAGGYINEHGKLHTGRLQLVLDELAGFEREVFEEEYADSNWYKGKQQTHVEALEKARSKAKLTMSPAQKQLFDHVKEFLEPAVAAPSSGAVLQFPATYPARDRRFLQDLADQLHLSIAFDEYNDKEEPIITLRLAEDMVDMMTAEDEDLAEGMDQIDLDDDEDEWREAINRVLEKYEKAPVIPDRTEAEFEEQYEAQFQQKMDTWRRDYYHHKLELDFDNPADMRSIAYSYIEGLQWVLHYYYDGVAAWGWFYPFHYSPKISELKNIASFDFNFELGTPFKPFEQLMGVLPSLSVALIPPAFRELMLDPVSPIIDFYPRNFESDLNGKKQDWEAVVKIPFIDEKRLLAAMQAREPKLSSEERQRNSWGDSWRVTYDVDREETYPTPLPGFFPPLHHCHSKLEVFKLPLLDGLHLVKGLCDGVLLGKDAVAGFPSLHTLVTTGQLAFAGVKVFPPTESKNETMCITIDNAYEEEKSEVLTRALVGKNVYINWPFLKESKVAAVSDELFRYEIDNGRIASVPHRPDSLLSWRKAAERLEYDYAKRSGVTIGRVDVMLHVHPLLGLKLLEDGSLVKDFSPKEVEYPVQAVVEHVSSVDTRYVERPPKPVQEEYPMNTKVFFLGMKPTYGGAASVVGHMGENHVAIRVAYFPSDAHEHFHYQAALNSRASAKYTPNHVLSRTLGMSGLSLSKITSSLMLWGPESKLNAGLNLKFEAKSQKVLGYSRKTDNGWEFSNKAVDLIRDYKNAFPEIIQALQSSKDLREMEDIYPPHLIEAKMKEIKSWLKEKKIDDLERVALTSDQLEADAVSNLEVLADSLNSQKTRDGMKVAIIKSIPRRGVLKPENAQARLQGQDFQLGDRVVMVEETGNVPLAAKGTVVGLQTTAVDVLWDVPFIGGTTLGGRCSEYRGQVVAPDTILNVSAPQLVASTNQQPNAPPATAAAAPQGSYRGGAGSRGMRGGGYRGTFKNGGPTAPAPVTDYVGAASGQKSRATPPASHQDSLRSAITGDDQASRPSFRYNNYQNVAPPSNINAPPSGARGRGRGRGGFNRGRGGASNSASSTGTADQAQTKPPFQDPAVLQAGPPVPRPESLPQPNFRGGGGRGRPFRGRGRGGPNNSRGGRGQSNGH